MKLHYSQTIYGKIQTYKEFDYHMKLHYSQTTILAVLIMVLFDYHMKLHYSQTLNPVIYRGGIVWLPYEITLLSNSVKTSFNVGDVWLPYEITLLSNLL